MFTRRALLTGSAVSIVTAAAPGRAYAGGAMSYDEAIAKTWATLRGDGGLSELVRYATLAANSHNTQPWRFRIEQDRISILPDFSRRCPAVDPDDHHLFASLGCAAENLVHAAQAMGLKAIPEFADDQIVLAMEPSASNRTDLFEAIPHRQCVRAEYDGQAIAPEQVRLLEEAGRSDGISVLMITGRPSDREDSGLCRAGKFGADARPCLYE
jgi:hypothetical protein